MERMPAECGRLQRKRAISGYCVADTLKKPFNQPLQNVENHCFFPTDAVANGWRRRMKRGLSLVDLARKIEGQRNLKSDFVAATSMLSMKIGEDGGAALAAPEMGSFPILPIAHEQIGERVHIPAPYYGKMLTQTPDLLAVNVNRWFNETPKRRMIRTLGGNMRAFLSDRYNRVENEEIAEVVLPILMETPGIEFVASEITDRRMYLLATTSRIAGEAKVGDVMQAGVAISNSETGHGSVSIRPMVYRLRCLNGMILPDGKLQARHVGRRISEDEDLNKVFSDEARKADDRALLLKVRDVVRHSLDEAVFNDNIKRFGELADSNEAKKPTKAVEVLAKKIGATKAEGEGILAALIKGGDLTAFGFVNAVTYQAHEARSFDRAVEFEAAGGKLLNLPKREWREILEAA